MKNKLFLRFLSFVFLIMVSGISFAMENKMKNYTAIADSLPITSIAPHPENNNVVAIVRRGKVNGKPAKLMEILDLEKRTRKIIPVPKANGNKKEKGIAFNAEGEVIPKVEEYEVAKGGYDNDNSTLFTLKNKNGVFWNKHVMMRSSDFFALNPNKDCVALVYNDIYLCGKVVGIYLVTSLIAKPVIKEEAVVTAVALGKNYLLLMSRTDNILVKVLLNHSSEYNEEIIKYDQNSRETYKLNDFTVIDDQEIEIEEASMSEETPNGIGWIWRLPKMRIVMLSNTCLIVALLLFYYTQYFSRMPA